MIRDHLWEPAHEKKVGSNSSFEMLLPVCYLSTKLHGVTVQRTVKQEGTTVFVFIFIKKCFKGAVQSSQDVTEYNFYYSIRIISPYIMSIKLRLHRVLQGLSTVHYDLGTQNVQDWRLQMSLWDSFTNITTTVHSGGCIQCTIFPEDRISHSSLIMIFCKNHTLVEI